MIFNRLSEGQLDALKEISNIGMGNAATALSQLTGETIYLSVPKIILTDIAQVPELIGGPKRIVAGITLRILGEARGNILIVFPRESAHQLLACLLRHEETGPVRDEIGVSTLKEVGNILASAYLSALGNLLHLALIPSVPMLAYDMAGAMVDHVLIELSEAGDHALMVETEFRGVTPGMKGIKGHFFLLPEPTSLGTILNAVGGVA